MEYILHILVLICIYSSVAYALDILVGHAGLLSLTQAAFFGIGAYVSAICATAFEQPFIIGVAFGALIAVAISLIVCLPFVRLRGDFFVLATFAFQMIVYSVLNNWMDMTRGALGISGIPKPRIFSWDIDSTGEFVLLAGSWALLVGLAVRILATSPLGRLLHAIRDDEVLTAAFGKPTYKIKALAFGLSSMLAAVSGSLYAHYVSYIHPTSFTIIESVLIIAMVIVGGCGSKWGPLIGAGLLIAVPEALRFLGLPVSVAAHFKQVLFGALLVVTVIVRPAGLVGRVEFGR